MVLIAEEQPRYDALKESERAVTICQHNEAGASNRNLRHNIHIYTLQAEMAGALINQGETGW